MKKLTSTHTVDRLTPLCRGVSSTTIQDLLISDTELVDQLSRLLASTEAELKKLFDDDRADARKESFVLAIRERVLSQWAAEVIKLDAQLQLLAYARVRGKAVDRWFSRSFRKNR